MGGATCPAKAECCHGEAVPERTRGFFMMNCSSDDSNSSRSLQLLLHFLNRNDRGAVVAVVVFVVDGGGTEFAGDV